MTVEMFLANFGHLADAPNGVRKLRELILQLAVQGKLVPQDPKDETAAKLLERIRKEKAGSGSRRGGSRTTPVVPVTADEMPYELPQRWEWVRAQDIMRSITDGDHLPPPKSTTGVPFLVIGNVRTGIIDYSDTRFVTDDYFETIDESRKPRKGDLLYTLVGSYGIPVLIDSDIEFCVQRHIGILKPSTNVSARYLSYLYGAKIVYDQATKYATGIAQKTVPLSGLRRLILPLPPLAEQHRIVAKVDQLMALCDELQVRQRKQQEGRERLNNAALDALLNASDPADFATHWQRICSNFDLLYDHPDTIAKLRAAILQLAVQGKLVPQDPKDESAEVLLEKIKAEKERLVKEKKIRKANPLPPVIAGEAPYDLPKGWEFVLLGNITNRIGSGSTPRGGQNAYANSGIPFLRSQNIWNHGLELRDVVYIDEETHKKMSNTVVYPNDILLNITGASLGRCTIYPDGIGEANVSQHVTIIRPTDTSTIAYLHLCILSPYTQALVWGRQVGMAREGLSKKVLELFEIPLPPLKEQKRIVAKVNQLMALCDILEAKLNQAKQKSEKLMEASVRQLLGTSAPQKPHFARPASTPALRQPVIKPRPIHSTAPEPAMPIAAEATASYVGNIPAAILAAMQTGSDYSRADLLVATGIHEADWIWAIKQLKEQGKVTLTGEKRGARYRLK